MYAHDGRLHFHRPFLDRLTGRKPDAPCALAAFLLLNVIDEMRHPEFDADAVNLRINAVYNPLGQAPSGDPQVFHLVRIAERLRQIASTRDVASITPDVIGYANWLINESRFDDALTVLDSGEQILANLNHPQHSVLKMRRGFSLTCKGRLNDAAAAYAASIGVSLKIGDEPNQLLGKVGLAKVQRLQGHVLEGRQSLFAVNQRAEESNLTDIQAIACHDIGVDPSSATENALPFVARAYNGYDQTHLKKRALADIAHMLVRMGNFELASKCISAVRRHEEGPAFQASVLGTLFWIVAQTANRQMFNQLLREYHAIDHQLALTTDADLKLRIGQGFLTFADYANADRYLNASLELSSSLEQSQTAKAAHVSREIIKGKKSIRAIQIDETRSPPVFSDNTGDSQDIRAILSDIEGSSPNVT